MEHNIGIAPPEYDTSVGFFRLSVGDTNYSELNPPETGKGSYEMFGDEEIKGFLSRTDSHEGAMAAAYMSLATRAALEAKTVQDLDLRVNTERRATELRNLAAIWQSRADKVHSEFFEITPVSFKTDLPYPELSARPVWPW